ncbi:MAG: sulfatase-like hydrolase/transferase [Candidatus Sulfomarinibacteraceae bacterium]
MKQLVGFSLVVITLVLLLSCGGEPAVEEQSTGLPSGPHPVVIIAVDGLRTDSLGAYGAPVATPAFDALAAESVRFEWAFAQAPEMLPSLAAMLSGLYPTTNGLRQPGDSLQAEAMTIAELAGEAGMKTAAFVEGAPGGSDYGLAQGFASYQVVARPGEDGIAWMNQHAEEDFLLLIAGWGSAALDDVSALLGEERAVSSERIIEVLASRDGDSPLLFDDDEMIRVRDWYAARVQIIDAFIGDFMAAFEAAGLGQRATLVVLGTNGFALQEHGDLFGETIYAPVTRVPLLVRFPGGVQAGNSSKIVEVMDLMPTLAQLVGVEVPVGLQGASLLPVIDGTSRPPYIAFGETQSGAGQRFAALAGYRAIATGPDGASELYHTAEDPLELIDISADEAEKLAKLAGDMEAWTKMVAATSLDPALRTDTDLDDETLKQLKSLGYVQ